MSQNIMTPEQKIETLKAFSTILAMASQDLQAGAEACTEPQMKRVLQVLADTIAALLFSIGCISGAVCDKCDDSYVSAGIAATARLDEFIQTARVLAQTRTLANELTEIPDPPEGSQIN